MIRKAIPHRAVVRWQEADGISATEESVLYAISTYENAPEDRREFVADELPELREELRAIHSSAPGSR
jgi:hypothetical protein